jgi:LmbE family N-acetylglucosaminyl deacetylase
MFQLGRIADHKATCSILCLGAHSDDIEIGCGGTILQLSQAYQHIEWHWIVFSADRQRRQEAVQSAELFLRHAKRKTIVVNNFKDGCFPFIGSRIKSYFEKIKQSCSPDLILTHYRNDLHQDHRVISDLTWNTFRDHLILEYEIPKYDGDVGSPNFFVHLNEPQCMTKTRHIMECFKTQAGKQWFTEDTFLSVMRIRGIESNAPSKYAEGFYCRKMVFEGNGVAAR